MACCPTCGQPVPDKSGFLIKDGVIVKGDEIIKLSGLRFIIFCVYFERLGRYVKDEVVLRIAYGIHECDWPNSNALATQVCLIRQEIKPLGLKISCRSVFGRMMERC